MVNYKNLRHILVDKDMQKSELTKIGISFNEISKIAKGEYITMHTLEKLCQYFHVTPDKIIEFVNDQNRQ